MVGVVSTVARAVVIVAAVMPVVFLAVSAINNHCCSATLFSSYVDVARLFDDLRHR